MSVFPQCHHQPPSSENARYSWPPSETCSNSTYLYFKTLWNRIHNVQQMFVFYSRRPCERRAWSSETSVVDLVSPALILAFSFYYPLSSYLIHFAQSHAIVWIHLFDPIWVTYIFIFFCCVHILNCVHILVVYIFWIGTYFELCILLYIWKILYYI